MLWDWGFRATDGDAAKALRKGELRFTPPGLSPGLMRELRKNVAIIEREIAELQGGGSRRGDAQCLRHRSRTNPAKVRGRAILEHQIAELLETTRRYRLLYCIGACHPTARALRRRVLAFGPHH